MDQAEQLRNIVKKQSVQRHLSRVITVTSGKGGVGKSSVAVNLGLQMSKLGKKVIILDADFGLANVEVMLGIRPRYNLADLMFKGRELKDIITMGPENIGFISGGSGIQELTNLTRDQIIYLTQTLYELDEIADVILIDTGAGISDSVLEFVAASAEILLIATAEPTSITDAYALLKTLGKKEDFDWENTMVKMIANRVNSYQEGKALYEKLSVVVNKFLKVQMEFLGAIPQDPQVSKSVMQQTPFSMAYPNSPAAIAVNELAAMLNSNTIKEQQMKKGITQFFTNLIRYKYKK